MRLTYLDILEHCFHDKFRGYDKKEVDTFLHLVADDFKEMAEEVKRLQAVVEAKDRKIQELETGASSNGNGNIPGLNPEALKEKARQIVNSAREQAEKHLDHADQELTALKKEIKKLHQEKESLIENIKTSARRYFNSGKAATGDGASSHESSDHAA